jgi:hypothetical protein
MTAAVSFPNIPLCVQVPPSLLCEDLERVACEVVPVMPCVRVHVCPVFPRAAGALPYLPGQISVLIPLKRRWGWTVLCTSLMV